MALSKFDLEPICLILYCTTHIRIIWQSPILFSPDPDSPYILLVSWRSSSPMLKSSGAYRREQKSWRPLECCHGEKNFFNSEELKPPLACPLRNIQWPIIIQIEHFMTCGVQAVSRVSLYTFSCDVSVIMWLKVFSMSNSTRDGWSLLPRTD